MEQANIYFKGVVNEPNNFLHEDGELLVSMNAVVKNGSVKAVPCGKTLFKFADGYKLVHVHENDGNKYYIFLKKNTDAQGKVTYSLHYAKNPGQEVSADALAGTDNTLVTGLISCNSVTHFKKILVVSTSEGIQYARIQNGAYSWIGCLPELPYINPYITTSIISHSEEGSTEYGTDRKDADTRRLTRRDAYYDSFFSVLNKLRASSKRSGRFNFPFFVRFGLRLYDGTIASISRPFLMTPNEDGKPILLAHNIEYSQNDNATILQENYNAAVFLPESTLSYVVGSIDRKYQDIIEGVEVYCSPEIVSFTESPETFGSGVYGTYFASHVGETFQFGKYITCKNTFEADKKKIFSGTYEHNILKLKIEFSSESTNYTRNENIYRYCVIKTIKTHNNRFTTLLSADSEIISRSAGETRYIIPQDITVRKPNNTVITPSSTSGGYSYYNLVGGNEYLVSAETNVYVERRYDDGAVSITVYEHADTPVRNKDNNFVVTYINRTDGKDVSALIEEGMPMYRIDTIPFSELDIEQVCTPILNKTSLENLVTGSSIDMNVINRTVYASKVHVYNNRISAVVEGLGVGRGDAIDTYPSVYNPMEGENTGFEIKDIYIKLSKDSQILYTKCKPLYNTHVDNNPQRVVKTYMLRYLFYPDPDATSVILVGESTQMEIPLKRSTNFFGAFWYDNMNQPNYPYTAKQTYITTNKTSESGKIYTSEINNPFAFVAANSIQIDCKKINSLCAATKPMSTSQFGQYPMYAFTDNGVYALSVGDTGTFSSVRPVSADVITGTTTQLDQSVLFNTAKGMMQISGQDVQCMSEKLNGHVNFECSKTPAMCALAGVGNVSIPADIQEFMKDAQALYSYPRNMIYFFKDGNPLGYVYSIGDAAYGMYENKMSYPVGGYEQALAVMKETVGCVTKNVCVNYDETINDTEESNTLLITRPISFGDPTSMKTVYDIVGRGICTRSNMKTALLASNDGRNYHVIASSQKYDIFSNMGTPYRYFALAVMGKMKHQDSLNGFTCEYIKRLNNILR